jgi:hypothetical protein
MLTRAFDSKWKNWVMRLVREGGGLLLSGSMMSIAPILSLLKALGKVIPYLPCFLILW